MAGKGQKERETKEDLMIVVEGKKSILKTEEREKGPDRHCKKKRNSRE